MKIVHHYVTSVLGSLIILGGIFVNRESYTEYLDSSPIQIGLQIINSYSGGIAFSTGQNIVVSGGVSWIRNSGVWIDVSATTGSEFTLNGDISSSTSSGNGAYSLPILAYLNGGDGQKLIYGNFLKDSLEPYQGNNLEIYLDQSSPSMPNLISPVSNAVLTGDILLQWDISQDSGIGLSHYIVHISLDAGFIGQTTLITSYNTVTINSLPIGTIFWYVEVLDYLGNSISTPPSFFHNQTPSILDIAWAGGGGGKTSHTGDYHIEDNTDNGTIDTGSTYQSGDNTTGDHGIVINNNTGDISDIIISNLLDNYYNNGGGNNGGILLPEENPTGSTSIKNISKDPPDARIYNDLIIKQYYNLEPLGYTLNYIGFLFTAFCYLIRLIQSIL